MQSVTVDNDDSIKEVITKVAGESVKPIVMNFLQSLYTVILLIVFMFVVKLIAKIVNKFFDFSVLGKINGILGGILGTVKGVIIACIFCTVIALIVSFTENGFWIFNNENIDKTIIFKLLANIF